MANRALCVFYKVYRGSLFVNKGAATRSVYHLARAALTIIGTA